MRHVGRKLFVVLVLFSLSILVFAVSEALWLSCVALVVYGAVDMVSVNIRMSMVQLGTPDDLRGRVNAVNSLCVLVQSLGDVSCRVACVCRGAGTNRTSWWLHRSSCVSLGLVYI